MVWFRTEPLGSRSVTVSQFDRWSDLLWPGARVETAAEIPAAKPLTSLTGQVTPRLTVSMACSSSSTILSTCSWSADAYTGVTQEATQAFCLRKARFGDGRSIPGDSFELRASVFHDPICRREYSSNPSQNWLHVTDELFGQMLHVLKTAI